MSPEPSNSLLGMRSVLVMGMSGTGKSTALAELAKRGFHVVETTMHRGTSGRRRTADTSGGRISLQNFSLARTGTDALRVRNRLESGSLLPALPRGGPLERAGGRAASPSQNPDDERLRQGGDERALILGDVAEVEPLLRTSCTHEIDATKPISEVVAQLVEIGRGH